IAEKACSQHLMYLIPLLDFKPIGRKLVDAIDRYEWEKSRLLSDLEQPSYFEPLYNRLFLYGRLELAEAPARSEILRGSKEGWDAPGVGLRELALVLTNVKHCSLREIEEFLV